MVSRRSFLKLLAGTGATLVIGVSLDEGLIAQAQDNTPLSFQPNVWIQLFTDETVIIWAARSEMGQGVKTALPMIVAEEMDADWSMVRVQQADADTVYGAQATGGSQSVRSGWRTLRRAGAWARTLLMTAAAHQWGVGLTECRTQSGVVYHDASGQSVTYGQLVEAVNSLAEQPTSILPLKEPTDFKIIGQPLPRVDLQEKIDGSAIYGLDMKRPNMLYAVIERCPIGGDVLAELDREAALSLPGVVEVVELEARPFPIDMRRGVAVLAENTWAAMQGRQALRVKWSDGDHAALNTQAIWQEFMEVAIEAGVGVARWGNVDNGLAAATSFIEAEYHLPYLSHSPMEPMNCVADVRDDGVEIWAPTQSPQDARDLAARVLGISPTAVQVHVTLMGGGFGRRLVSDFVCEAVLLSHHVGRPVQVVWTREDDTQFGFYRPASYHKMRAGIDANGQPVAWNHRFVGPSVEAYQGGGSGADRWQGERAIIPYNIPNFRVESTNVQPPITAGWWRAVDENTMAFPVECFVDEVAVAVGSDPFEFRRNLMTEQPRLRAVLEVAAEKAGWGETLPVGWGRGIAAHYYEHCDTHVAHVAEVSVDEAGKVKVHRIVSAIDCGIVVNPDIVTAQVEGAIAIGLSTVLHEEITIEHGRVQQSNFTDYPVLRMRDMPLVEVHIMASGEAPGGVGEPGVPPTAPAVLNAIYAATGKRLRQLPIRHEDLQ